MKDYQRLSSKDCEINLYFQIIVMFLRSEDIFKSKS